MTVVSEIQVQAVRDLIAGAEKMGRRFIHIDSLRLILGGPELVLREIEREAENPRPLRPVRLRNVRWD